MAMSYASLVLDFPQELQRPLLQLAERIELDLRSQLAVRREDFDSLNAAVAKLAVAQQRTEERVSRLEAALIELAAAQQRTEKRVEELAAAQQRTERSLDLLINRVGLVESKLGQLVGDNLERRYRERAYAYLGQILRPVHAIPIQDMLAQLELHLQDAEVDDLLPLDVLLRGRIRERDAQTGARPEVWLAMEISAVVDKGDVERAMRRAALLRKAGLLAIPTVAGETATEGASLNAELHNILLLQEDGQRHHWEEALAAVLSSAGAAGEHGASKPTRVAP
jgi:ribosomal 50S subunit-associated protein YjgA (DUF615 family)